MLAVFPVALTIVDLFQSPTVAGLAARIENLKRLTAPLNGEKSTINLKSLHSVRTPKAPVPLSFSQQYMRELHHESKMGAALNSSIILRVNEQLIPSVVEQSLNEIVRRHEILRTVFQTIEGQPTQIALPSLHLPLTYVDLQQREPERRESEALSLAIEIAQTPFDLAAAPLMRTALFQLAPQEQWLLITMHHIITDGWSFGVLLQELHTLIKAFSSGLPSPLPDVSLQYADFAWWQQQVYDKAAIAQQLDYWRHKLIDEAPMPEPLPDRSQFSREANHYFTQLPESLIGSIESLSRSLGVTDFVVLLAALKLALAAWSGQREISIVTTVGNRTMPETEQMLGCFINDVIVRSQLLPEQTGAALIKQLQANVQEAIDHKDVPIKWVIEQTKRARPLNLMASITITSSTQRVEPISGWEVVEVQTKHQHWNDIPSELFADYTPLEVYVEQSKPIQIVVNYSNQKFTEATIAQLLANYQQILTTLVVQPEITLLEFLNVETNGSVAKTGHFPD